MKRTNPKTRIAGALCFGLMLLLTGCKRQLLNTDTEAPFKKGQRATQDFFTGEVWVQSLVNPDATYTTATGQVYFAAKARSHWHSHPSGQILIVTAGEGYHQIKGQARELIRKGDVIKCPPNTDHWHGATENSAMTHLYIVPNTEKGVVNGKEPVSDIEFISSHL